MASSSLGMVRERSGRHEIAFDHLSLAASHTLRMLIPTRKAGPYFLTQSRGSMYWVQNMPCKCKSFVDYTIRL